MTGVDTGERISVPPPKKEGNPSDGALPNRYSFICCHFSSFFATGGVSGRPLGEACSKTGWQVLAYCLMQNPFTIAGVALTLFEFNCLRARGRLRR